MVGLNPQSVAVFIESLFKLSQVGEGDREIAMGLGEVRANIQGDSVFGHCRLDLSLFAQDAAKIASGFEKFGIEIQGTPKCRDSLVKPFQVKEGAA